MFNQMTEQFEKTMKPVNALFAANAKVLEQLAQQQTKLFTDVLNDSVAYSETLGVQKDMAGAFEVQKSFIEGVQVKMINASKEAQVLLTEAQEKAGASIKEFWAQEQKTAAAAASKTTK